MIIGRNFVNEYYEDERLYSTGNDELDEMLEKAFCEGYEYAQKEYSKLVGSARTNAKNFFTKTGNRQLNRAYNRGVSKQTAVDKLGFFGDIGAKPTPISGKDASMLYKHEVRNPIAAGRMNQQTGRTNITAGDLYYRRPAATRNL